MSNLTYLRELTLTKKLYDLRLQKTVGGVTGKLEYKELKLYDSDLQLMGCVNFRQPELSEPLALELYAYTVNANLGESDADELLRNVRSVILELTSSLEEVHAATKSILHIIQVIDN